VENSALSFFIAIQGILRNFVLCMKLQFPLTARAGIFNLFLAILISYSVSAQSPQTSKKGDLYLSWGYNTEWYTNSELQISQPGLNNNYTFTDVKGHDRKGWDQQLFSKPISVPQYNYRLGYFFNEERGLAFEINFDHTKFIFSDGPSRIKGTLNGIPVDKTIDFNGPNGFYYFLNNGANFLLFNIVKRWKIVNPSSGNFRLDLLGKAGIGPVIPHVQNSFFGHDNKPHFQLGGWNTGLEVAIKATFFKHVFIEYTNKLDYARYSGLRIYEGTAKHAFGTYEMILNLGVSIPLKKN
jgi:hypothetical protein